jgi:hypothetical protein
MVLGYASSESLGSHVILRDRGGEFCCFITVNSRIRPAGSSFVVIDIISTVRYCEQERGLCKSGNKPSIAACSLRGLPDLYSELSVCSVS